MLDHLIFNKLKWFNIKDNAETMQANGKKYVAVPTSFTVKRGSYVLNGPTSQVNAMVLTDTEVDCCGASDDVYFFATGILLGSDFTSGQGVSYNSEHPGVIRKSDVKNVIWGGKSLLFAVISMVKYAFTSFKKGAETC